MDATAETSGAIRLRSLTRAMLRHGIVVLLVALAGLGLRYGVYIWRGGSGGLEGYARALCVWDCGWYRSIAEGGYDLAPGIRLRPGGANWAFFPLSPILAGLLARLTGLSAILSGFLLSNAYAVITALVSRPLFRGRSDAYWLFVVGLLAGPFSFLFSSLHTEALFILLTTLGFLSLERGQTLRAGLLGALLSATRVTGVLFVFAILADAIVRHARERGSLAALPARLLGNPSLVLALVVAPLGLFAYIAFLQSHVGDGFGFAHIQRGWGRDLEPPWAPVEELFRLRWPLDPWAMVITTWTATALVGLALCVLLAFQRRVPAALFCALCLVVSMTGGPTSLVRFVAGLAPLGWALCDLLSRWKPLYILAFPAAVAADLVLTLGWLNRSAVVM